MKKFLLLTSAVVLLAGCQTGPLVGLPAASSAPSVMELWETYSHCRSTLDLDAKEADARRLNVGAQRAIVLAPSPIPLPALLKRHVVQPLPRFSVDPKAMSASCGLLAGQTALQAGRNTLAVEMFELVLRDHAKPNYHYYVDRARKGLRQAETRLLASRSTSPDLIPVSYPAYVLKPPR